MRKSVAHVFFQWCRYQIITSCPAVVVSNDYLHSGVKFQVVSGFYRYRCPVIPAILALTNSKMGFCIFSKTLPG